MLLETAERARAEGLVMLDVVSLGPRQVAVVPCACAAGAARVQRWRGLPAEADDVRLSGGRLQAIAHQRVAVDAVRAFVRQPRGWLTLAGGYGVGKTMLIYAAINHLADRGVFGRYVMLPLLLGELRDAARAGDIRARLDRYATAPVLALDEADKFRDSPFVDEVLEQLLLPRYQARGELGTILAYNHDGQLPPFVRSRLRDSRFALVELGEQDLRPIADRLDPWDRGPEESPDAHD